MRFQKTPYFELKEQRYSIVTDHHPAVPFALVHIYNFLKKRLAVPQPSKDNSKINVVSLSSIGYKTVGTNNCNDADYDAHAQNILLGTSG